MKKYLNKFYQFIDKIGKPNFILLVFFITLLVVTSLYQTFSLYTSSEGISIIDGIKTFKFILNSDTTENSVTIAAGSSKHIAITVSNKDDITLKYGIYYTSDEDLTEIDIGYKRDTEYLPNGTIDPEENYIITIQIENNSDTDITISFGTLYGLETGGDLILESNQYWLEQKWNFPLTEVSTGSYVRYIGNNGCSGMSCSGQNANYVDDTDMGTCRIDTDYHFITNGWRIGYIKDNSAFLISAGSTDCLATDEDGNMYETTIENPEVTNGTPNHLNNITEISLKYCNVAYTYQNTCTNELTWGFNTNDFQMITNKPLYYTSSSDNYCFSVSESTECGYGNDLIDNGGSYWYATSFRNSQFLFAWSAVEKMVVNINLATPTGVRPVIRLDSSIVVTGGTGTYQDPYIIDNPNTIKDLSGNMNNGVNIETVWDTENGTIVTDGESNYINCGLANYNFGSEVSLVIRLNLSENTSKKEYFLFGNLDSAGLGISLYNGNVIFSLHTEEEGYASFSTDYTLSSDTWYTIVGTYDGTSLQIYINGEKLSWDSTATSPAWSVNSNTNSGNITSSKVAMAINTNLDYGSTDTNRGNASATYSDALIFTRALTEEEIISDYSEEVTPTNIENLLLYYDFKR